MATVTESLDSLPPPVQAEVRELAVAVGTRDGAPPLSDEALVHLAHPAGTDTAAAVSHVLARQDTLLVGYAQYDPAAGVAEVVALLDAEPLIAAVEQAAGDAALLIWSHGRRSPVGPAAEAHGYRRVRELWQLRRGLSAADRVPDVPLPAGVALRAFRPGDDEEAWLAVNAAAFASHPEQGRWQRADVEAREAEAWFDPAGLLLAEDTDTGELLGFHWTKIHPGDAAGAQLLGEVYVLAVAPAAQGRRLGAALLAAGLAHLANAGCTGVLLYVDGDNTTAMRLYEKGGFARHDLDVQYART